MNEAYLKRVIEKAREKYHVPAVAVSIMDSHKILYSIQNGVRVDGTSKYVTSEDYFHIGSCSKSILAYMAAKQVEKGILDWNTKFFDLFPELKKNALEVYHEITLEDLFFCRAGIKPYTSGDEIFPNLSGSENQQLDFIRYLLQLSPSSKQTASGKFEYLYSNAGYMMVSAMIERVTDMTYKSLIDKYLKEELGLDVFIGWPNQISKDQPWGHYLNKNNTLEVFGPDSEYFIHPLIEPAGNLSMKPRDFARYVQLHLKGLTGHSDQLRSETFKHMDTGYKGLTFGVINDKMLNKSYVYFDGSAGTFYARGVIVPESNLGIAIMINNGSAEAVEYITMKIAKAYFNWWWMFWV
ncbi:MAG: beta-lactamase family protein [Clostridia bacterium]|nr:beta-lactamase family protein [Clostridia bacterium]